MSSTARITMLDTWASLWMTLRGHTVKIKVTNGVMTAIGM